MAKKSLLNFPYVQAAVQGAKKRRPTSITLILSETTSDKGAALAIALHQHKSRIVGSHFTVDDETTYLCIPPTYSNVESHDDRSIRVLICAEPHEIDPLWEDGSARPVLYRTAQLVARLSIVHKIPIRYVDGPVRRRRKGGIILNVRGSWPSQAFLHDVQANITYLKRSPHGSQPRASRSAGQQLPQR